MANESKCPFTGGTRTHTNRDWWPNQLNLQVLHQHFTLSNPMGEAFDYAKEFESLDLNGVPLTPSRRASPSPTGSATISAASSACRLRSCWSIGRNC